MVLEKILESPLDCKEIKPVNPKGNPPWIFTGRTDAKAPALWPLDAKSQLLRKDTDAGKDWGQGEKATTKNEMVGWYHQVNGHEFEKMPGDSEGQGSLACCSAKSRTRLIDWTTTNVSMSVSWGFLKEILAQNRDSNLGIRPVLSNCYPWESLLLPLGHISLGLFH